MYYRFGKVFHFLGILLFIFALLYSYSALSDRVAYTLSDGNEPVKMLGKSQFFYTTIIIFLVLNVVLVTPAKLIENQATPTLKRLFPKDDQYRDYLLAWLYSFTGIVNISLSILLLFVHSVNNQNEIGTGSYAFFFYLIPVFFVVWMAALAVISYQKFQKLNHQ
jgi:hypothetical protein